MKKSSSGAASAKWNFAFENFQTPWVVASITHAAQVLFFSFALGSFFSGLTVYPFIMTGLGLAWGTAVPVAFHALCYYLDTKFFKNVLYANEGEDLSKLLKKHAMFSLFLNGICPILGPILGVLSFIGKARFLAPTPAASRIMYAALGLISMTTACLFSWIGQKTGIIIDPLDCVIGAACLFGQAILPLQGFFGMIKAQNIPSFLRPIIEFIRPSIKGLAYIPAPELGGVLGFASPYLHRVSSFIFRSLNLSKTRSKEMKDERDPSDSSPGSGPMR